MQLVYPRHVLLNTKTLLKETNLTMDCLINLELNAHPAVSPLFFPVANSNFFVLQYLFACVANGQCKITFLLAAQEDNPIITSRSPTPDVIEAVPIETQPPTSTDEDHRSRPLSPDPIQTQVHTETTEPRRSCPPTPDTTVNVDEQQQGNRSNSS
jgi:hypothetical protein